MRAQRDFQVRYEFINSKRAYAQVNPTQRRRRAWPSCIGDSYTCLSRACTVRQKCKCDSCVSSCDAHIACSSGLPRHCLYSPYNTLCVDREYRTNAGSTLGIGTLIWRVDICTVFCHVYAYNSPRLARQARPARHARRHTHPQAAPVDGAPTRSCAGSFGKRTAERARRFK